MAGNRESFIGNYFSFETFTSIRNEHTWEQSFFPIVDSLLSCMIFSQYLDLHVPVIFLLLTLNAVTLRRVYFSSLTTDDFLLDLEAFLWGYLLWFRQC